MSPFTPKKYQQDPANQGGLLDSVEAYFKAIHTFGRASVAFTAVTKDLWKQSLRYTPRAGFAADRPYSCLCVPVGALAVRRKARAGELVQAGCRIDGERGWRHRY